MFAVPLCAKKGLRSNRLRKKMLNIAARTRSTPLLFGIATHILRKLSPPKANWSSVSIDATFGVIGSDANIGS